MNDEVWNRETFKKGKGRGNNERKRDDEAR
jgi:hypothetical protein